MECCAQMTSVPKAGCLLVLNNVGQVVKTFSGSSKCVRIYGPWDMTALDLGAIAELFVSNVLNGTVAANGSVVNRGTVVRIVLFIPSHGMPQELLRTAVGSAFGERTDPAALVIGPTGLGLGADGTLFVADSVPNRITAIRHAPFRGSSAGTGQVVTAGGALMTPLGLTVAPKGHVLTVNGGNGRLVETTPGGAQIATRYIDKSGSPAGAGALFGLVVAPRGAGLYYVDDAVNTLRLLH